MSPALLTLMRLQGRGLLRRLGRVIRSPRGAVFFLLGVGLLVLWLGSLQFGSTGARSAPQTVRAVMPLALLAVCVASALTSVGDKAIAFTPAEVDFLFPGPFKRRELLLYKIAKSSFAALLTALLLSAALRADATIWFAGYLGIFLSLLLVQFFSMALLLAGQAISQSAWSRGRQVALGAAALLAAIGIRAALRHYDLRDAASINWLDVAEQFTRTPAGRILVAPFVAFGWTLTAPTVGLALQWGAAAAGVDALLLLVVILLDADYLEAAAHASHRRYERLRRLRGRGLMAISVKGTARQWLPAPPWLGGAGPIAWRQLTGALRSARGLFLVLALLAIVCGPFLVAARQTPRSRQDATAALASLGVVLAAISFFVVSQMRFDFRGDLDAMETLKTLPLRPWAIAAGQLAAPTLLLSAFQWIFLAATFSRANLSDAQRTALLAAAAIAPAFNLLLVAAENLIFLFFPSRLTAVGPGDFQVLGRQFFSFTLRSLVAAAGVIVAIIAAVLAWALTRESALALTITADVALLCETIALIPLIAIGFQRFDPSMHTPGQ